MCRNAGALFSHGVEKLVWPARLLFDCHDFEGGTEKTARDTILNMCLAPGGQTLELYVHIDIRICTLPWQSLFPMLIGLEGGHIQGSLLYQCKLKVSLGEGLKSSASPRTLNSPHPN